MVEENYDEIDPVGEDHSPKGSEHIAMSDVSSDSPIQSPAAPAARKRGRPKKQTTLVAAVITIDSCY